MEIIDFNDKKNVGFYEWKDFSDRVAKDLESNEGKAQQNVNAIKLYKSYGFYDSGVKYEDDCVFVRLPKIID